MINMKFTKTSLGVIILLLLASCASEPRQAEPEGDVAYLQNRADHPGRARFEYYFEQANEQELGPGFWETTLPFKMIYKIPPGETVIGLKIVYVPAYGKNIFARGNDRYYYIFLRDLEFSEERIEYMSEKIPEADPESLSGIRGLSFDAEGGSKYQIGSRIENGRAYVWIEELDGTILSDTVLGFADAHYTVHTRMEVGMHSSWHGAPNLGGGWKVLDDLPDPVN